MARPPTPQRSLTPRSAPAARPSARRRLGDGVTLLGATLRHAWHAMGEDNVFFLAGGIAFNILLAIVPFVLLLVSGLTFVLALSPDASASEIAQLIDRFLPPHSEAADSPIHLLINDIIRWGLRGQSNHSINLKFVLPIRIFVFLHQCAMRFLAAAALATR